MKPVLTHLCLFAALLTACVEGSPGVHEEDTTDLSEVSVSCQAGTDCASGVCDTATGSCLTAACDDGVKNGGESDVDCAGTCAACVEGAACTISSDCVSRVCANLLCAPSSCDDQLQNGDEVDVDCGGLCGPCQLGDTCLVDGDYASGDCRDEGAGLACVCPAGTHDDGAGA